MKSRFRPWAFPVGIALAVALASVLAATAVAAPRGRRVLLISGRDLHWYGVHMVEGLRALNERLSRLRAAVV